MLPPAVLLHCWDFWAAPCLRQRRAAAVRLPWCRQRPRHCRQAWDSPVVSRLSWVGCCRPSSGVQVLWWLRQHAWTTHWNRRRRGQALAGQRVALAPLERRCLPRPQHRPNPFACRQPMHCQARPLRTAHRWRSRLRPVLPALPCRSAWRARPDWRRHCAVRWKERLLRLHRLHWRTLLHSLLLATALPAAVPRARAQAQLRAPICPRLHRRQKVPQGVRPEATACPGPRATTLPTP